MTEKRLPVQSTHYLERLLAVLAAVACLIITIAVWLSVSAFQPMWPLPALYLIEMPALSILAAAAFVFGGPSGKFITWAAVGVFLAFCVLGALSVGFLYLPTALMFAVVSVTFDVRDRQNMPLHPAVCLVAGLAQAAVMLTIIRLL